MDRVETAAKALWEAADVADEYPWETLAKKRRERLVRVIRDILHTTALEELFFVRNQPPENADAA